MSGDVLRPWQKWKRKLGVMASDESIVNVVHSSLLTMSVLWQLGEARLLPLLLWNNLFLFASYRLRPATTGIQQPVKGPSNETKGQIGKYKKVRKEECVPRLSSTNPRQCATVPFRINVFWKFKEKMKYWLWEFVAAGSQSWEYHSFGIHFAWQAAVFQYGKCWREPLHCTRRLLSVQTETHSWLWRRWVWPSHLEISLTASANCLRKGVAALLSGYICRVT